MNPWKSVVAISRIKEDQIPNGPFKIIEFLQFQNARVESREISPATLRNFVKAIKLFCEMTDIDIKWKKITPGLPKTRRYADDRAPTLEEIQIIFCFGYVKDYFPLHKK
jgi:hypothetical protein